MTYLLLGGPSGLGRSVAEGLAARGEDLVVVSSDQRDAHAQAADLTLRFGVRAEHVALDLAHRDLTFDALDLALGRLREVRGVIVTAGASVDGDLVGCIERSAEVILRVNFLGPCLVVEHLLPVLAASKSSLVVGIGSVAACRGRRQNVAYSAAKRALQSYFESLRHTVGQEGTRVHFYTAGYLDTNLSFGRRLPLPAASPHRFARRILSNLDQPSGCHYYPRYWRGLCALIRIMPWALYRRLRH